MSFIPLSIAVVATIYLRSSSFIWGCLWFWSNRILRIHPYVRMECASFCKCRTRPCGRRPNSRPHRYPGSSGGWPEGYISFENKHGTWSAVASSVPDRNGVSTRQISVEHSPSRFQLSDPTLAPVSTSKIPNLIWICNYWDFRREFNWAQMRVQPRDGEPKDHFLMSSILPKLFHLIIYFMFCLQIAPREL